MKKFVFTVSRIREETDSVISIFFETPSDFSYNAGDCIDIGFLNTSLGKKTFSFASSPQEDETYITYKKGISPYKKVMELLKVGDKVFVTHFGSNFIFHPGKKSIFIAGGVGVTPLRSMIYTSIQKRASEEMILIYLNNTDDFIFYSEFLDWQKDYPNLQLFFVNTQKLGRISKKLLQTYIPSVTKSPFDFYLSGPPLMIDAVSMIVEDLGLMDHLVHTDSFDGYTQELE